MQAQLHAYLEEVLTNVQEEATLRLLEAEVKRRKIKQARVRSGLLVKRASLSQLSEQERMEFTRALQSQAREISEMAFKETQARWGAGDSSWLLESTKPAHLFFDTVGYEKPNVVVGYPWDDRPWVVVDIVKSVERDPKNIGNPLIVAAIERYANRLTSPSGLALKKRRQLQTETKAEGKGPFGKISLTSQQAEERLKRLFDAVTAGAKSRARRTARSVSEVETYLHLLGSDFNEDYFAGLSTILKDSAIKKYELLKTNWRSRIGLRLQKAMPTIVHQPVLDFLIDGRLPKRRTPSALRNAFFAWQMNIQSRSLAVYRSKGLKFFRELSQAFPQAYDLSDILGDEANEELGKEATDHFMLNLGFGHLDSFVEVRSSNLVWDEALSTADDENTNDHVNRNLKSNEYLISANE